MLAQLLVAGLASAQVTVTVSPASISYGNNYVGTITGSRVVTITNPLTVPLQLKSIAVTGGPNPADYPIGIMCPMLYPMTPGQVCSVNVRYRPTSAGINNASFVVTDSASNTVSVALTGTGTAAVGIAPASLAFPSESLGTTSPPSNITLTNTYKSQLSLSSIATSGDFAVSSNTCSAPVNINLTCTIGITFSPTATGARTGSLTISDNAPGSPTVILLTGTGIGVGTATVSPTSISYGNNYVGTATGSRVVTITNPLAVPLQLKSIAVTGGPNPADYPLGIMCPMLHPMTPGQVCSVNVSYRPTSVGINNASFVVTDSAANTVSVALTGTGLAALTVAPTGLAFPSESLGATSSAQTITLTNSYRSQLTFSSITASGDFALSSNTCSASLNVNLTCAIGITFTPTATGARTGALTIADNAPGGPTVIPLSGTGNANSQTWGKIQHVVIIFMENRTPDNMFQDPVLIARGADIASSGLNSAGQIIPLTQIDLGTKGTTPQLYDLDHSHLAFTQQYDGGKMDGADKVGINCYNYTNCPPANPQFKYVLPADVAPYFQMAEQYTFADRMFQTNEGPSFPAHQFIISGTSAPTATSNGFAAGNPSGGTNAASAGCTAAPTAIINILDPLGRATYMYPCFEHPTLTDLLEAKGVTWRYYTPTAAGLWTGPNAIEHMCGPNAPPPNATACTAPDWINNVVVATDNAHPTVFQDIANGNLAQVSWVMPDGLVSDHAATNNGGGPSWVAQIVNAIGASPYWSNTAIFITWDDWGGWYDHVKPLVINDGVSWGSSYVYGFRVPLIVVSPYAKPAYISHVTHDFGSILNFVEQVYSLPSLGYADARADDLSDCFNFNQTALPFTKFAAPLTVQHILNMTATPTDPDDD